MAKVDIEKIEPNSFSYRGEKEKKKLDAVVGKDSVVSSKKTLGEKFRDTFVGSDTKDIKDYIIFDVMIPGIKDAILDMLSMAFFGEVFRRDNTRRGKNERRDYSSYSRRDSGSRSSYRRDRDYESDDKIDYRHIVLRDRIDAEEVIDKLKDRIRDCGEASVADLYDLINMTSKYTDNNYGWTRESQIGLRRVSTGFLIDVEEARYLG